MERDDYIIVARGEAIPRAKPHPKGPRTGDKPNYFPAKPVLRSEGEQQVLHHGKACRVSGGYVATAYGTPAYAAVHQDRKTGKIYSSVFHKWETGTTPRKQARGTVFDRSTRVETPQHVVVTNEAPPFDAFKRSRYWRRQTQPK